MLVATPFRLLSELHLPRRHPAKGHRLSIGSSAEEITIAMPCFQRRYELRHATVKFHNLSRRGILFRSLENLQDGADCASGGAVMNLRVDAANVAQMPMQTMGLSFQDQKIVMVGLLLERAGKSQFERHVEAHGMAHSAEVMN